MNDSQFGSFLRSVTTLKASLRLTKPRLILIQDDHIQNIFHRIYRQGQGDIRWDDFYLVIAILLPLIQWRMIRSSRICQFFPI